MQEVFQRTGYCEIYTWKLDRKTDIVKQTEIMLEGKKKNSNLHRREFVIRRSACCKFNSSNAKTPDVSFEIVARHLKHRTLNFKY
jgi:hypothetical protein